MGGPLGCLPGHLRDRTEFQWAPLQLFQPGQDWAWGPGPAVRKPEDGPGGWWVWWGPAARAVGVAGTSHPVHGGGGGDRQPPRPRAWSFARSPSVGLGRAKPQVQAAQRSTYITWGCSVRSAPCGQEVSVPGPRPQREPPRGPGCSPGGRAFRGLLPLGEGQRHTVASEAGPRSEPRRS